MYGVIVSGDKLAPTWNSKFLMIFGEFGMRILIKEMLEQLKM